jgi:hypothetical protein
MCSRRKASACEKRIVTDGAGHVTFAPAELELGTTESASHLVVRKAASLTFILFD